MPERDLTKISRIFKNIKNDVEVMDADLYKQQTWRSNKQFKLSRKCYSMPKKIKSYPHVIKF